MWKGDEGCRRLNLGMYSSRDQGVRDRRVPEITTIPATVTTCASQIIPSADLSISSNPTSKLKPIVTQRVLANTTGRVNVQCSDRTRLNVDCSAANIKITVLNKSVPQCPTSVVHNPEDITGLTGQHSGNLNEEQASAKHNPCQSYKGSLQKSVSKCQKSKDTRDTEFNNTVNQLQTSKQTIQQLESQLKSYQESVRNLSVLVQESRSRANQLELRLRSSEEEIAKKSMLVGRLRHLERQTGFLRTETSKQSDTIIQLTARNCELVSSIASLKEEISAYLSDSIQAPHAQIYSLNRQLATKDRRISQLQQQIDQAAAAGKQAQSLVDSNAKYCRLVEDGNQELMRERVREMDARIRAMRLY